MFRDPSFRAHERVVFAHDRKSGAKIVIAVHNTRRGPALGGVRMMAYPTDADAITDVLRLSWGMTYKNAMADLPHGGGKSIIVADPATEKTEALLHAYAEAVNELDGRYVAGQDVGLSLEDMDVIAQKTAHISCSSAGGAGDPSPATAFGVFKGIEAAAAHRRGLAKDAEVDLSGVRVAVQGLGHVGAALAGHLHAAGAKLILADIAETRVAELAAKYGAETAPPERIHSVTAEVFAPCALGAGLNARTIPEIQAKIVAGAANNQLETRADGKALAARGILYAPDYVINAGGVISIHHEGPDFDRAKMLAHVARIRGTLAEVFERAAATGAPTHEVADAMAEARFAD